MAVQAAATVATLMATAATSSMDAECSVDGRFQPDAHVVEQCVMAAGSHSIEEFGLLCTERGGTVAVNPEATSVECIFDMGVSAAAAEGRCAVLGAQYAPKTCEFILSHMDGPDHCEELDQSHQLNARCCGGTGLTCLAQVTTYIPDSKSSSTFEPATVLELEELPHHMTAEEARSRYMYPAIGAIVLVAVVTGIVTAFKWRYVAQVRPKSKSVESKRVVVFGSDPIDVKPNSTRRKRVSGADHGHDTAIDVPAEPAAMRSSLPGNTVNRRESWADPAVLGPIRTPPPRRHSDINLSRVPGLPNREPMELEEASLV